MKLSVSVLAASTCTVTANQSWQRKEWEVQDAYFADKEIVLSDPKTRKVYDSPTNQRFPYFSLKVTILAFYAA